MVGNVKSYWYLAVMIAAGLIAATALAEDAGKLAPYPSPEARVREWLDLAAEWPDRVEVIEYGQSVNGEPLLAVRIHRPGGEPKPAAWFGGCIHGNEWIGNRMVTAIGRMLIEQDGADPLVTDALDRLDFFITPCINPDGYQKTWDDPTGGAASDTASDAASDTGWAYCRKNARGVDLNRNWPMPKKPTIPIDWAGSPDPGSVHYRGPAPLSEPETAALDAFFREHGNIIAGISFHSTGAVQYPAHCPSHACMVRHKAMSQAFKSHQGNRPYPRLQSRVFDTYTGELEDWLYAEYGMLAMDVEISDSKQNQKDCGCDDLFWSFNPRDPSYWIENDARAAIAAMVEADRIMDGKRLGPEQR